MLRNDDERDPKEEVDAFLAALSQAKPKAAAARPPVEDEQGEELLPDGEVIQDMLKRDRFLRLKGSLQKAILEDVVSDIHELSQSSMLALLSLQLVEQALEGLGENVIETHRVGLLRLASEISARAFDLTQNTRLVQLHVEDVPPLPEGMTLEQWELYFRTLVEHVNKLLSLTIETTEVSKDSTNDLSDRR